MKAIRNIFFIPILLMGLLLSCAKYDQRIVIKTVDKEQLISLHKKQGQGTIRSMGIRGSGRIDGKARIVLMLNGAPYKTADIDGEVSFAWSGNWQADSMKLRYQPLDARSGELIIEYHFGEK